jgi:excinuclease ABC subunit C
MIHSVLEDIDGIGDKTIAKLLSEFGSVSAVSAASLLELNKVVDLSKAQKVYEYFHKDSND